MGSVKFRGVEIARNRAYRVSVYRKLFHTGTSVYAAQRASELEDAFRRRHGLALSRVEL